MSNNRKLTHWFAPGPSGKQSYNGASASLKPRLHSSPLAPNLEDRRVDPHPCSARPSLPISDKAPKAARTAQTIARVSQLIDLADSGVETDNSVEITSARATSSRKIPSSQSTLSRMAPYGKGTADSVRKGVDPISSVEKLKHARSSITVEVSSDTMTPSTISPKSSISVSDNNSDIVPSLTRRNPGPSSAPSKRQRVSESRTPTSPEPGRRTRNESARKRVEINLTMRPSRHSSTNSKRGDEMERVPAPLLPAIRKAAFDSKEAKKLSSNSLTSNLVCSQTTPTSTFTRLQSNTAAEIVARMKADASAKPGAIFSDDEIEDNRAALAAALAEDTSDNDDEDDATNLIFGQKSSKSQPARKHRNRNLFSTSSLSPPPEDCSDDVQISVSGTDDSQSEYPAPRRSSRVVAPPKPITTFVPFASRPRRKQSEFDRLFLEDARRKRSRGGVDGYKQAESLAAVESSSANEGDSSDGDQDAGSVVGSTKRLAYSVGTRSRSSRGSSVMSDNDDEGQISEANARESGDEPPVSGMAQKYLGREDTKKLRGILQDDMASSLRSRILVEDGAQALGDKRSLWEKTNVNNHAASAIQLSPSDPLVKRLFSAIQNEKLIEAAMCLQRWETCQQCTDPIIVCQFVDVSLYSAICSPGALVGDNVISSLVRLIERYSNNLGIIGLRVRDVIIAACASLGARHDILRRFNFAKADPPSIELIKEHNIVARGKPHRALCSTRYIRLMTELATHGVLQPDELSDVVVFLVLIACDPSSPSELERRVTRNLQEIYDSSIEADTERRVCDDLIDSFKDSTWFQKHLMISLLPNHTAPSRRLQAWAAFGLLAPNELYKVTTQRFLHPPPLVSIITQLLDRGPKTPKQDALFDLRESMEPSLVPDFDQIAAQTHILDIMLTDVRAFVEYERELEKARMIDVDGVVQPVPMPIATGKKRTVLDVLINGLQLMHDGITDSRAAHLDRTRLKQILQRLQVRLAYEKHSALEFVAHKEGAPMRVSLDAHFSRAPSMGSPFGPSI